MPHKKRDPAYLWDILHAGQSMQKHLARTTLEQFLADELKCLAVERLFEIMGEAARRISEDFKQAHQEIPWADLIALRHVVAHEYDNIDYDEIWAIAAVDVPKLLNALRPLVPAAPPNKGDEGPPTDQGNS
jgi:uncharacterized protein with HEPN domain